MRAYDIKALDSGLRVELEQFIDDIAKPKGSLGRLEEIALQVGLIQGTRHPRLTKPHHILFCADHGVEVEGVSLSPRAVTWQQTLNFKRKGTAIDYLCRQHGIELIIVDSGVDYDFPEDLGIINAKIRKGTHNYLYEPAMSYEEVEQCLERGARQVEIAHSKGCNIISFGEMGISNTSASALWMHRLTGIRLADCIGAGSGLDQAGMQHKLEVLQRASDRRSEELTPLEVMQEYGGFEMVMTVGAMLRAAEIRMPILVDGFIMTACILLASRISPNILEYAIFGHKGEEKGHAQLLDFLGGKPLLDLGMKLGEGTGAVCAYPIVQSAVLMMTEMSLFSGENLIDKYF